MDLGDKVGQSFNLRFSPWEMVRCHEFFDEEIEDMRIFIFSWGI